MLKIAVQLVAKMLIQTYLVRKGWGSSTAILSVRVPSLVFAWQYEKQPSGLMFLPLPKLQQNCAKLFC
jgi:hypothetical protein